MAKPTFKNAAKGIGMVFGAQILALFAGLVIGLSGINEDSTIGNIAAYNAIMFIIGAVMMIIALIIELVGIHRAGEDNDKCGNAFTFAMVALVIVIIYAILHAIWPTFFTEGMMQIAAVIAEVCGLFAAYYIISGSRDMLEERGENSTASLGKFAWNALVTAIVVMAIAVLIALLPGMAAPLVLTLVVISAVAGVVADICLLVFLGKTKNRLA